MDDQPTPYPKITQLSIGSWYTLCGVLMHKITRESHLIITDADIEEFGASGLQCVALDVGNGEYHVKLVTIEELKRLRHDGKTL